MNDDLSDAADRGREKQGPRGLSDELGASGNTSSGEDASDASSDTPGDDTPGDDTPGDDTPGDDACGNNSAGGSISADGGTGGSQERGRKEPTTRFTADLPDSLHREFKIAAAEENRSMKDLMVRILESYLGRR